MPRLYSRSARKGYRGAAFSLRGSRRNFRKNRRRMLSRLSKRASGMKSMMLRAAAVQPTQLKQSHCAVMNGLSGRNLLITQGNLALWNAGASMCTLDPQIVSSCLAARVNISDAAWLRDKMIMYRYSLRYFLSNSDRSATDVEVYYCQARYDTYYTADINQADVNCMPNAIISQYQADLGGTVAADQIMWTPYDCPKFCSMFKVYKKKAFRMKPGETRSWSQVHKKPKLQRYGEYDQKTNPIASTAPRNALRPKCMVRGSKFCVILCKGELVPVLAGAGASATISDTNMILRTDTNCDIRILEDESRYLAYISPYNVGAAGAVYHAEQKQPDEPYP